MTQSNQSSRLIDAKPTKDFFISMLVKDIPLIRAIIDLVDNSIDGALRTKTDGKFNGLWVKIIVNENSFIIEDNCGGISKETAQKYAFRFGRPEGAEITPRSVGLFGVGMKRAIFKMGDYFTVESKTNQESFRVEENIPEWSQQTEWDFEYNNIMPSQSSLTEPGTKITVTKLHENIKSKFKLESFVTELISKLEAAQQISLEKGLEIIINDHTLQSNPIKLYFSEDIQPSYLDLTLPRFPSVEIKIYTGIYKRNLNKGGWYLFCNNRLILYADQTYDTGWGIRGELPKYHPDFALARGYVYFTSDDATLLPWNTTKTGVDTDSQIYKATRREMIKMMQPVTTWLRNLARVDDNEQSFHLKQLIEAEDYPIESLSKIAQSIDKPQYFLAPDISKKSKSNETIIRYTMSTEKVEHVKRVLGLDHNSEAGRRTFEYFYAAECDE